MLFSLLVIPLVLVVTLLWVKPNPAWLFLPYYCHFAEGGSQLLHAVIVDVVIVHVDPQVLPTVVEDKVQCAAVSRVNVTEGDLNVIRRYAVGRHLGNLLAVRLKYAPQHPQEVWHCMHLVTINVCGWISRKAFKMCPHAV